MKFAVQISGKKFPVTVMREPNNMSALANFDLEGKTYKGLPSQFNGLRYDKGKERYTAISIIVTDAKNNGTVTSVEIESGSVIETPILEEPITETTITEIPVVQTEESLPEQIEESSLDSSLVEESNEEEEVVNDDERKLGFLNQLEHESKIIEIETQKEIIKILGTGTNGFKKLKFQSRLHDIFNDNIQYGEGIFEKQKTIWIRLHGSEHLKMAHDMQSKCDSLYIQERANLEFPKWDVHELLVSYDIDSPDYGILTFLKNFKKIHQCVLNTFRSKVSVAITDANPNEDDPIVVISDYLGHCDLSISLVNLVELYGDRC